MKTRREHSPTVTKSACQSYAFIRHRYGGLASLILLLFGLHLYMFIPPAFAETSAVRKSHGERQWNVQVDSVDSGEVTPDPFLEAEIHRDLVRELTRTKKFRQVLRSDGSNGNDVPDLLILKTTMEENAPSSKTRRPMMEDAGLFGVVPGLLLSFRKRTPAIGATQLNVRLRLYTREGHLVLENVVRQNIQSVGDTLQATQRLAHNMAATLKRSSLPEPATTPAEQETARAFQIQNGHDR
jgi:hypothetical protein